MQKDKGKKVSHILLLILTAIAILGIISGVLIAKKEGGDVELTSFFSLGFNEVLKKSLMANAVLIMIVAISGTSILFMPLSFALIYIKALSYGFTATNILLEGSLYLYLAGVTAHNFLGMSVLIYSSAKAITKASENFLNRENYSFCKKKNKEFIFYLMIMSALMILVSLIEAILVSII